VSFPSRTVRRVPWIGRARSAYPDGVLPALPHLNDPRSCGTVAAGRIGPVLPIWSGRHRHCIIW